MLKKPQSDWYLHEWFATQGLTQSALVTRLDYAKNTANRLWHGLQPYRRDHVDEIAALLNIRPHELLMPPEEAMRIRRLEAALAEVAGSDLEVPTSETQETAPRRKRA